MPDYLQDIIDRSQSYQDPATYPVDNNVPPPWEDPNAKKKKVPSSPVFPGGTAGPADPSTAAASGGPDQPPGMVFIPGRGYVPRGLQSPQQSPGPVWGQGAGMLAPPNIGGLPPALPVYPGGVPLPQSRPAEAPARREPDGSQSAGRGTENAPTETRSTDQVAGEEAIKHGPPRGAYMQAPIDQAGQQAGLLGPLGGVGDWLNKHSNTLLAMGAGLMGAPNLWQGLGRGFAFAGPASQQDIKMQTLMGGQNAAYQALKTAGVPEDLARLGATDKDVMKQLMEEYFTGKTQSVNVKLPSGVEVTAQYDPHRGTYTDIYGRPFDPNAPGMGGQMIDPSLTGEAARAEAERVADPATYRKAMALVEGRMQWPVGRAMQAPGMKQATDLALQIDPQMETNEGKLRSQTVLDYGPKGKTGQTRLALSNMMGHAEQLDKLNEIVGNWDAGGERANRARNELKTLLGTDKTYLDAKAQADLLRTVLGGEAHKAFSGSQSVTGTEEMIKTLGGDKGHTAQHGAIKGMIHAAGTRLGELQSQFDSSMNTKSEGYHMLSPKAQKIFRKWEGDAGMDWDKKAPASLAEAPDSAEAFAPISGAKAAPAAPQFAPGKTYNVDAYGRVVSEQ